jgi:hypothetical protein
MNFIVARSTRTLHGEKRNTPQCANPASTEIVRICPIMLIPTANSPLSYNGQTHSCMSLRGAGCMSGANIHIQSHSHAMRRCQRIKITAGHARARYKVSIKAPFRARHTLYVRFFISHQVRASVKRQLFV